MDKKIIRLEANAGTVTCFAITAITLGLCIINGTREKQKKDIELKKIEADLKIGHARLEEMLSKRGN